MRICAAMRRTKSPVGCTAVCTSARRATRAERPRCFAFEEQMRAQFARKDGVPAFHPEIKRGGGERRLDEALAGKGAAAHVRPEIEQPEHARNAADVVGKQHAGGRGAEQMHGGFDEFERGTAGAAFGFARLMVRLQAFRDRASRPCLRETPTGYSRATAR